MELLRRFGRRRYGWGPHQRPPGARRWERSFTRSDPSLRLEARMQELRRLGQLLDELLDVGCALDAAQVVRLPARGGDPRREELAAVLVREDRDVEGAQHAGDLDDL